MEKQFRFRAKEKIDRLPKKPGVYCFKEKKILNAKHSRFLPKARFLISSKVKECLIRRFKHPEWSWPDLILIDGGRAQLNAALSCLTSEVKHIGVMAIAKKKNKLYLKNRKKPISLKNLPREIFNLILQLRDEAHRFALAYHRKLRKKKMLTRN